MPLLARRRPARGPARPARILTPRGSLTAAAQPVGQRQASDLRRLHQIWQPRALGYYDTIGECWYPAQFYARAMERIRFYPAILNDAGEPEEADSGPLLDLFQQIRDPSGGMSELAGTFGRLDFLIGDGYLIVSEEDGDEVWEMLSPLELRVNPDSGGGRPQEYRRLRAPGATPEELTEAADSDFTVLQGNDVRVWRLYRRHPTFSAWSDSPVRAVLDLYALLAQLTLAAGAESTSRAAQRGGFYWPTELSDEMLLETGQEEDPDADPVMVRFERAYQNAIRNPGSTAAAMPILLKGPAFIQTPTGVVPMKDCLGWFPLGPSERYFEGDMWDKTINRIGGGLDMPLEMVSMSQSVGSSNHWSGFLLDESGFRQHVAPRTVKFCNDIAMAYLRPAAEAENLPDADRVTVWYDPAEAILHPDQTTVAKDAFDRYAISWEALRDAGGFSEEDAPDDQELNQRIDIATRRRALVPPEIADAPVGSEPSGGETSPADGGRGGDVKEGPPQGPQQASAALQVGRILGAAEIAVERARELAGNRLRRRAQSCPECMERIHGVPNGMVAAAMGAARVRGVLDGHGAESELVADAGRVLVDRLNAWGVNGGWPERLGAMVEQHALATLYEGSPGGLPASFAAVCAKAAQ